MPVNKKAASRAAKHRWPSGSQGERNGQRDAREAVEAYSAARNALAAAFSAPVPVASPAQVTVRRKRAMLLATEEASEEADKRPAEGDADKRSPRVFRLTTPVLSGEAEAGKDASPNAESASGAASAQDALALPAASLLDRIGHDRRARTIRRLVVPPAPEDERANEAELRSQESTLVNRITKLTDCANALRELQQRRVAAWAPLEARIERTTRRMKGLHHQPAHRGFVPLMRVTSKMLGELRELAKQLDAMRSADDVIPPKRYGP